MVKATLRSLARVLLLGPFLSFLVRDVWFVPACLCDVLGDEFSLCRKIKSESGEAIEGIIELLWFCKVKLSSAQQTQVMTAVVEVPEFVYEV